MTIFAPYTTPDKEPKYDFREPEGRKASTFFGDIARGAAKLFDEGVKGLDTATKATLDDETSNYVDTLRNQNIREYQELTGNVLAATGAARTGSQTATGGSTELSSNTTVSDPSVLINAPVVSPGALNAVPGPISSELRMVDKMNEGMRQGHFDSERFYGEVQARTANLISRYPGYSDYIQSKVTHYLGTDPANAQREHLQQTIRQLLGNDHTQSQAEKWNHEVMAMAPVMGGAWTGSALKAAGNPDLQNMYRVQFAQQKNKDHVVDMGIKELNLRSKAQDVDESEKVRTFTALADNELSKFANTAVHASGDFKGTIPDIHASIEQQRLTGRIDVEGNQQRALAIGGAKENFNVFLEREWIKPRFNPDANGNFTDSFSTIIKDPNAKSSIFKKYTNYFDTTAEQIGAGLMHLATTNAELNTQKSNNAVAEIYKQQSAVILSAMNKAYGPIYDKIFGIADTQSNYKLSGELGAGMLKAAQVRNVVTGASNGNTLMDQLKKIEEANNADPRTAGKKITPSQKEALMHNLTTVLSMPDAPVEIKMKVLEVLSHPDSVNFLDSITKEQQFKAYATLFSPDATNFIKDHKANVMWDRYKETAGESFAMIYGNFANDIKSAVRNNYRGKYTWDEKSQQIIYEAPDRNSNPAKTATTMLNQGLRVYGSILAAEGQKITPETLGALGIDLNRPEGNPTLDQIKESWKKAFTFPSAKRPEGTETPIESQSPMEQARRLRRENIYIPPQDKGPLPTVPLKEDQRNVGIPTGSTKDTYGISEEFISEHINRPLFINGVPVVGDKEKRDILNSLIKTKEGRYYWNQGNGKLVPVNL